MRTKQKAEYKATLEASQKKLDDEVTALGERIRTEVIIPLCKKYKLTFTSGMGDFFFTDEKNRDYGDHLHFYERAQSKKIFHATRDVLELLAEEVSHNQCLGYYVGDAK